MSLKILTALAVSCLVLSTSCASKKDVKTQQYARLSSERTFEYDFPTVWKGIESAFKNHKVESRDPEEVEPLEMNKLTERQLETDWIYSQSRDKYHEYKVNGSPRKKYLQARFKYEVDANSVMGGTKVLVKVQEEIEKLKEDGTPAGYSKSDEPDAQRANEILDKINQAILSAAP